MRQYLVIQLTLLLVVVGSVCGRVSPMTPFMNYSYWTSVPSVNADLWWTVNQDQKSITFELHMNTTGWIAMGISPAGGMYNADIGVGWVTSTGNVVFQDRFAYTTVRPILDNTTIDWFALRGREQDGWTAIQFKRQIDTCDPMDVPIKSGSNILIFAWGLTDPNTPSNITYHETRRGSLIIPLQSYATATAMAKFAGLEKFDFRVNNNTIPTNESSYYCKVFKIPSSYPQKRHVIAREVLIDPSSRDYLHHLTLCECDATATFDDTKLPEGDCDANVAAYALCTFNIIMAWATGGDPIVEYPEEAGLPVGSNFTVKYYMIQYHYYNVQIKPNNIDNSGMRFYLANQLRPNDLGALVFGLQSSPMSIIVPPNSASLGIDSYCPAAASLANFPSTGLTVISTFPHTHNQGKSVGTKLVRNKTAIQYLFNAESYDFNHQFEHRLPKPIQIYPGDEFATRCVYMSLNKTTVTIGGRRRDQEMCIHTFTYYPRMNNMHVCASGISPMSWQILTNIQAANVTDARLSTWLANVTWTSNSPTEWQQFYNTAARAVAFGRAGFYNITLVPNASAYIDLKVEPCVKYVETTTGEGSITEPLVVFLLLLLSVCFGITHHNSQ